MKYNWHGMRARKYKIKYKMAALPEHSSTNRVRSFIQSHSNQNEFVLTSLQSCKLNENLSVLQRKIERTSFGSSLAEHLQGLQAILDCLLAKVHDVDDSIRVGSYISFEEAFSLFKGYSSLQHGGVNIKTCDQRKRFKELLLHPEFGLCVHVISFRNNQ